MFVRVLRNSLFLKTLLYVIVICTVYLGLLTGNKSLCFNSLWDFESSIYYILVEIKLFFGGEIIKLYLGLVKIILHYHTV